MSSGDATARWMCCHLGAREHYAVPRALHSRGRLHLLITDAWVRPGSAWTHVPGAPARRLTERFHPDLTGAEILDFTTSLMAREALWRSQADGWDRVMSRNRWFGEQAAAALQQVEDAPGRRTIVFAHSYSAREVFAIARSRGWATVLGQIDPGEQHARIVERLAAEYPEYGPPPAPPPAAYFDSWRDECRLADRIVVNSEWSRDLLVRAGVDADSLKMIPLVYDAGAGGPSPDRAYPAAFTRARPLRILFVGQVSVAKGAAPLLEAMALVGELPVELRLVGAITMQVPERWRHHPAIHWVGAVSRGDVMRHYQECDVLVFPSLSDGFGMAQIEAQGWRLPVIASRSCGRVVQDGVNGMLLDTVSPASIAAAIRGVAADPALLAGYSRRATRPDNGLTRLGDALMAIEP